MYDHVVLRSKFTWERFTFVWHTSCSFILVLFFLHFLHCFFCWSLNLCSNKSLNWFGDICHASVKQTLSYRLSVWSTVWFIVGSIMSAVKMWKSHRQKTSTFAWKKFVTERHWGICDTFLVEKVPLLKSAVHFTAAIICPFSTLPVPFPSMHWETGKTACQSVTSYCSEHCNTNSVL